MRERDTQLKHVADRQPQVSWKTGGSDVGLGPDAEEKKRELRVRTRSGRPETDWYSKGQKKVVHAFQEQDRLEVRRAPPIERLERGFRRPNDVGNRLQVQGSSEVLRLGRVARIRTNERLLDDAEEFERSEQHR